MDDKKRIAYDKLRKSFSFYDHNDPMFIDLKKQYVLEGYKAYWNAYFTKMN